MLSSTLVTDDLGLVSSWPSSVAAWSLLRGAKLQSNDV